MRRWFTILFLVLCAATLRAQPPNGYVNGFWSATNQSLFPVPIWTNNSGNGIPLSGPGLPLLGGGLPTNWVATNTVSSLAAVTNLSLLGQKNVSFFLQYVAITNIGGATIGNTSNVLIQFQVSPDIGWWTIAGQASNALWISDTNYVLSVPVVSNNAASGSAWTNSGWTNFNSQGWQGIRVGPIANLHTNLIVTNMWLEYFYK